MLNQFEEMIERFLVGLGQALARLSKQEERMITLLLVFLVVAAGAARALQASNLWR